MFQVLLVLTFALVISSVKATACPDGWISYSPNCYKFDIAGSFHWSDCVSKCQTLGASMLCITDSTTDAWIKSQITGFTWIGLSDYSIQGSLKWVPGCSSTYTNWETAAPFGNIYSYRLLPPY